jgi:hypothetical protein
VILAGGVYVLCLGTSILCVYLLVRSYTRTGARLLFWTALCFAALAVNNLILFVDLELLAVDLTPVRHASSLAAIGFLLYGFIWQTD